MATYSSLTPFAGADREAQIWRVLGAGHPMAANRLRTDALVEDAERERLARDAGARRVGIPERLASFRTIVGAALIRAGTWLGGQSGLQVKVGPTTDLART